MIYQACCFHFLRSPGSLAYQIVGDPGGLAPTFLFRVCANLPVAKERSVARAYRSLRSFGEGA